MRIPHPSEYENLRALEIVCWPTPCAAGVRSSNTTPEEDAYMIIRMITDQGPRGAGRGERSIAEDQGRWGKVHQPGPDAAIALRPEPPFLARWWTSGKARCADVLGARWQEYRDARVAGVAYWSYLPADGRRATRRKGARLGLQCTKIKARHVGCGWVR